METEIKTPAVVEWAWDAWQRHILFLDVLRERGNVYERHNAEAVPHVLEFPTELVLDGRTLARPVNYGLVRIPPPEGYPPTNPTNRAFVIVDPRAGHGPGIGGMKASSEIGVVLEGGHPCYFIGFSPDPMPGQTVEDVCLAEAHFIAEVARRHPESEGKPAIIANCQAGWQIMMMAAMAPDIAGPILIAGSPLSYWAGVRGKNPMRYLGGLLGGTWLTALAGDLGHGKFDGAYLVQNFESMNPANTLWSKPYNVYSKVDSEAQRFLDFETWWGSPVLLNAGEMRWIADNLFVGNKLTAGKLQSADGVRIDLKKISSPIIVFCSQGDDITPPQQALGWITDLYADDQQLALNGQTIVYSQHPSIGHLGIFVSGKVAAKEHDQFVAAMTLIDLMPPGLYEAILTDVGPETKRPDLIHGRYLFHLERRSVEDIRTLCSSDPRDPRLFETAARVSEIGVGLYDTFMAPAVRMASSEATAKLLRDMHPNRLRFEMFSDRNPVMAAVKPLAEKASASRRPASADNPLVAAERDMAGVITRAWEVWGEARDMMAENMFLNIYGSPWLQALVGMRPGNGADVPAPGRDLKLGVAVEQMQGLLEGSYASGGMLEARMRALAYVWLPSGRADERGLAMARAIRAEQSPEKPVPYEKLRESLREQMMLVTFDPERALASLPSLVPEPRERRRLVADLRKVIGLGEAAGEEKKRLDAIEAVLASRPDGAHAQEAVHE